MLQQNLARVLSNGTEDNSILQSGKQGRGTRLSFLGSRKKDQQSNGEPPQQPQTNGDTTTEAGNKRGTSKDNSAHRRSFFRSHGSDSQLPNGHTNHESSDWATDSGGRASTDTGTGVTEKESGVVGERPGVVKMGSVRKRLSMLKLGKKNSKASEAMGSLDEE